MQSWLQEEQNQIQRAAKISTLSNSQSEVSMVGHTVDPVS